MSVLSFPDPVFESLLEKLVKTIEITQGVDPPANSQTRQALFQATVAFKDGLAKAKDLANTLPGGELLIEEQDGVIAMLEKLRDSKRAQLSQFSSKTLATSSNYVEPQLKMEVDSTASSPHD